MSTGKMTIMVCNTGLDLLQRSGNFPCAIFLTVVGSDRHACTGCTRSAVGASAFKMTQTTDALYVKELPHPYMKSTGGGSGYIIRQTRCRLPGGNMLSTAC